MYYSLHAKLARCPDDVQKMASAKSVPYCQFPPNLPFSSTCLNISKVIIINMFILIDEFSLLQPVL